MSTWCNIPEDLNCQNTNARTSGLSHHVIV